MWQTWDLPCSPEPNGDGRFFLVGGMMGYFDSWVPDWLRRSAVARDSARLGEKGRVGRALGLPGEPPF